MAGFDTIIKGGTIVTASKTGPADIGLRDGTIAAIGDLGMATSEDVIDAKGLHILPGIIDTQVHFREPGLTHKEDLESGSRGAVLGGVTTVFEMPNTNPLTTSADTLADKLKRAHHRMFCDHAFFVGGTHENVKDIPELENLAGAAGIKVFMGSSTGSLLVPDDEGVRAILSKTKRRVSFHSEDEDLLQAGLDRRIPGDPSSHPSWRSPEVAVSSTRRLLAIQAETGAKVHVLHISTADELPLLAAAKRTQGRKVTAEVTQHHLTLAGPDDYQRLGTYVQMNPPVRDVATREALWRGVADGTLDILGSDHAPHTHEEKRHPYPQSHSGMTGVQTTLPILLNHVAAGRLSLQHFVRMSSETPAEIFRIKGKGQIAEGFDADLVLVDLARIETISNRQIASRVGWTPYDGKRVQGWPIGTILRGHKVAWDGEVLGSAKGEVAHFHREL
jgi:dihydroorotase